MKISIGENIKALRAKKGVTQEQLSEVLGVTCAAVSKWERGETFPDITLIFPIAYYFGVSVDELMGYNEGKVEEDIMRKLDEYSDACRKNNGLADKIIADTYKEYPNDHRVMSAYMWSRGVYDAEPDLAVARDHKDELSAICDKILAGCADGEIRARAWKMKAILLHAEGKTDEALKIHDERGVSWYDAAHQMNEQLFTKDRPEFLYWARRNAYELSSFASDKISKGIFFDSSVDVEERIARIEKCGDALGAAYEATGHPVFAEMARALFGRLSNDVRYRGVGTDEDLTRTVAKWEKYRDLVAKLSAGDRPLCDALNQV
ncbi:MAG: helix-turn-helix transcriptional regulator [Clostridia bacterium]|nr:helix-turn-helix transcriptional regulator [Clostridia bacterium]